MSRRSTTLNSFFTSFSRRTSAGTQMISPISLAAAMRDFASRPQMMTRAPAWKRARAIAFPIPREPPVTSAVFPARVLSMGGPFSRRPGKVSILLNSVTSGGPILNNKAGGIPHDLASRRTSGAGRRPQDQRDRVAENPDQAARRGNQVGGDPLDGRPLGGAEEGRADREAAH